MNDPLVMLITLAVLLVVESITLVSVLVRTRHIQIKN